MTDPVTVLKALADETRLRILNLLWEGQDLCLCEIEAVLRLTQSNASRHLSRLREAGLINTEKRGQWTHFHLLSGNMTEHRDVPPPDAAATDTAAMDAAATDTAATDTAATDGEASPEPAGDAGDLLRLALRAARDSMDVLAADRRAFQAYRSSPYRCETIRTWREVYWSVPDH